MLSWPTSVPVVEGEKLTWIVQLALTESVAGQLFV